jgi:hypothetical protein
MRKIQRAEAEPFQAFSPTDSAEDPHFLVRFLGADRGDDSLFAHLTGE